MLKWFALETRREQKYLHFGLKFSDIKKGKSFSHYTKHSEMFPLNPKRETNNQTSHGKHLHVNRANSEYYGMSAIPFIQRKLYEYVSKKSNSSTSIRH